MLLAVTGAKSQASREVNGMKNCDRGRRFPGHRSLDLRVRGRVTWLADLGLRPVDQITLAIEDQSSGFLIGGSSADHPQFREAAGRAKTITLAEKCSGVVRSEEFRSMSHPILCRIDKPPARMRTDIINPSGVQR